MGRNKEWRYWAPCIVCVLAGIIFIILGEYTFKEPASWWSTWGKKTSSAVGTTLLSAGAVSVLIEMTSIDSLLKKSIKKIFEAEFPIESYSEDRLKDLSRKIAVQRAAGQSFNCDLYECEDNIFEVCKGKYYEKNYFNTVITPSEDGKTFHKTLKSEYEVKNAGKKDEVVFGLSIYHKGEKLDSNNIYQYMDIRKIEVNENTLSREDILKYLDILPIEDNVKETYDYMINFKYPIETDGSYSVKYEFEYDIPIDDISQIYKLTMPCKDLVHSFFISTTKKNKKLSSQDVWKIKGNAFTAFFCKYDDTDFRVEQTVDESVKIAFKKWALPGAGYVVTLEKRI